LLYLTFSIYSAVNGSLNFFDVDAASGRLVIDSSGNVGIGVTDPEKKLEIKSDTTYDGILIDTLSAPEINFRDLISTRNKF